jgi:hypothetical protein
VTAEFLVDLGSGLRQGETTALFFSDQGPIYRVKKVQRTLVQALRLCTGRTTHRGVEVLLCSFVTKALEGGEG